MHQNPSMKILNKQYLGIFNFSEKTINHKLFLDFDAQEDEIIKCSGFHWNNFLNSFFGRSYINN